MKTVLLIAGLVLSPLAQAEVAVIVHPSNAATLDADSVSRLRRCPLCCCYEKSFPGGAAAVPLALSDDAAATAEFNDKILKKPSSQLKAYWSKLIFTGKGTPPKEIASDAEMVKLISSNPNMIGFVDAKAVDGSVKVVLKM